jgi:OOP family OmpA-OmpF porin
MNKSLVIAMVLSYSAVHGQEKEKSYVQPVAVGIYFTFNDFETAGAIRNSSLSTVLREKKYGKLQNMSQGLAVSYGQGLSEHYDFVGMLGGAFLSYPVPNTEASANEALLMEADASIRGKMFSDKHWFVPYLQAGVGISKYQGYWGTFIPVGVGIQISFFGEAYLHINSQYRVAVSESSNYHFVHSIGLVGNIGKRN